MVSMLFVLCFCFIQQLCNDLSVNDCAVEWHPIAENDAEQGATGKVTFHTDIEQRMNTTININGKLKCARDAARLVLTKQCIQRRPAR